MYYPRFTKVIIHYFLTQDKTVSWRNKISMHTSKDDYLINTLRFVSAKEATQIYGAILPESLTSPEMKESKAYKTYLVSPEEPTGKSKRVKRPAKKSTKAPARGVVIRETPEMPLSMKKEKVDAARGKGIEMLSDVALTEEDQYEEIIPSVTNEGTDVKLEVPDVTEKNHLKNDSDNDKTQSNDENESDSDHENDENESGSESDQEENEEDKDDEEEVKDEFVKTPSNDFNDEDETKITDKAEGDEDEEMDYTTNHLYDDANIRLNEPVDIDKGFIQEEGNQTNGIAGTRDNIVTGHVEKKTEPKQEYILIPICTTDPLISQDPKVSEEDAKEKTTKMDESGASDKDRNDDQATRSEFEKLLQQEKQTVHPNNTNSINTVSTLVSAARPSFTNDDPSSPVNAAKASNAFEEYLFERFSPFKNAFTLPPVSNQSLVVGVRPLKEDFVHLRFKRLEIHSIIIQIRILSMNLKFFRLPSTTQYEDEICESLCRNGDHYDFDCSPSSSVCLQSEPVFRSKLRNILQLHQVFPTRSLFFDQFQPPQYPVIHHSPQETSEEVLQAREDLMIAFNLFKESLVLYILEKCKELMSKLLEDVRNINEELSEFINSLNWNRPTFYNDDDDEYTIIYRKHKEITPDLSTTEPDNSLSMGDEHLNTIPEMEKSSVENLVSIPSEFKGISEDICDMPSCEHFDAECGLINSLLSRDISIISPKIDFLPEEFAGELDPILPRINEDGCDEDDFDKEEGENDNDSLQIRTRFLVRKLFKFVDSDFLVEEVDTFLVPEDSIPPGIESDLDSEGDIVFLDDLLYEDPIPEYERFTFDIEPDAPVINNFDELNEENCFD
ncbi:hypothetical protein Tco_0365709 [Tanacetum coccineum]